MQSPTETAELLSRNDIVDRVLDAPASALLLGLTLPPQLFGWRAFAYPIPTAQYGAHVRVFDNIMAAVALLSPQGDVTIAPASPPTEIYASARVKLWSAWSLYVFRPLHGWPLGLFGALEDEIDVMWNRVLYKGIRRLSEPDRLVWCNGSVTRLAEQALIQLLDTEHEIADLDPEVRRSLPSWIGDRYRVARYLAPADAALQRRRKEAWRICPGPLLDALRRPLWWHPVLAAIDAGRPLGPALCEQLQVEPWAFAPLTHLRPIDLARALDKHGAEPGSLPTERFGAALAITGLALAPRNAAESRFLLAATLKIGGLRTVLFKRTVRVLRAKVDQLCPAERDAAWSRLADDKGLLSRLTGPRHGYSSNRKVERRIQLRHWLRDVDALLANSHSQPPDAPCARL